MSAADAATPARRAAYEVLRRTFEHDAWADRAFPAAAERHGLTGRDRAQAQRLAFGAVQRRGTTRRGREPRSPGATPRRLDPPVLAALRLGLFELLFSDAAAAHAAVDAAVELAKGGMRRGGARRAAGAAGLVNAVLRRAAREREAILASLSDDEPEDAAIAHSVPGWLAELWWAELGPDERPLAAARDQRAARDGAAGEHASRRPGCAPRGRSRPRASPCASAAARGGGRPAGRRSSGPGRSASARSPSSATGTLVAQSRGAQAVVSVLDPRPGRARPRPLRRAGSEDGRDRRRGWAAEGEVVAVERDAGPRRPDRRALPAGRRAQRARRGRRTRARAIWAGATIGCSWIRPAPTWERSPPARTRAGARTQRRSRGSPTSRARSWRTPSARCAPAARSSTRRARSRTARTASWLRPGRAPRVGLVDRSRPALTATRTDGFFIARHVQETADG